MTEEELVKRRVWVALIVAKHDLAVEMGLPNALEKGSNDQMQFEALIRKGGGYYYTLEPLVAEVKRLREEYHTLVSQAKSAKSKKSRKVQKQN